MIFLKNIKSHFLTKFDNISLQSPGGFVCWSSVIVIHCNTWITTRLLLFVISKTIFIILQSVKLLNVLWFIIFSIGIVNNNNNNGSSIIIFHDEVRPFKSVLFLPHCFSVLTSLISLLTGRPSRPSVGWYFTLWSVLCLVYLRNKPGLLIQYNVTKKKILMYIFTKETH
jgi:hypothetical protein